jgi:thiol-disulfide isomerase/thioredoxin
MLKKLTLFTAVLIFHLTSGICQDNFKPFTVEGSINRDTGKMTLFIVGDSSLYPPSTRHFTAPIVKGKFIFKGDIPHGMGYTLRMENTSYYSDNIVIEPGIQKVVCDIDSATKLPQIDNRAMKEDQIFKTRFSALRRKRILFDSTYTALRKKYPNGIPQELKVASDVERQSIYDQGDRNLLTYVIDNPGSYWALWRLISLTNFGYENIFDEIFSHFNDAIKNGYSGRKLAELLRTSRVLGKGKKFPRMNLLDIAGKKSAGINFKKNKFTLVDFWYTNCGPCLARFPSYIALYDKYHVDGFEIACIATDKLEYAEKLPVVIKKHKLNWIHFWDLNGKGAAELSILAFPTSYLVDAEGNILQKNISSDELDVFLKKNL